MRLDIEIRHGQTVMNINASVGDGSASVKWLGMMSAHRFASVENSNFIGSGLKTFRPLPKNVYSDNLPFLFPDSPINEALVDGEKVYIDLYDRLPLDEHSVPMYHPWYIIAFHLSETKREVRTKLIQQKEKEAAEINQDKILEVEEERRVSNLPKLEQMRAIMRDQLSNQNSIEAAMRNEWDLITNSSIFDTIVSNREEQEAIRVFLLLNYADLSHMYKYYSAVNSQGGTHTLEFIEFSKLVHETEILSGENANVILTFFGADPKRSNIHSEIKIWEFFVSFIKIAIYKYITLPRKQSITKKKKGRQATVSRASRITPSQAVKTLYIEHFAPRIARLPASAAIKASLGSEEGLLMLHNHLTSLRRIFCNYAETHFQEVFLDDKIQEGAMTMKQFSAFARFFLGFAMSENGITLKDVRQVFSASQSDEASNEEVNQLEDENFDSHQELMVFPEFIEAVARLGVLKFPDTDNDGNLGPIYSIRKALEMLKEN